MPKLRGVRQRSFLAALLALLLAPAPTISFHFFVSPGEVICFTEEITAARSVIHIEWAIDMEVKYLEDKMHLRVYAPKRNSYLAGPEIHSSFVDSKEGRREVFTEGYEGAHHICITGLQATHRHTSSVRMFLDMLVHDQKLNGKWTEHKDPASGRKFYHNKALDQSLWAEDGALPKEAIVYEKAAMLKARDERSKGEWTPDGKFLSQYAASQEEMEEYERHGYALVGMFSQVKHESDMLHEGQREFKRTVDVAADRVWFLSLVQVAICVMLPIVQTMRMKRMFLKKKLV